MITLRYRSLVAFFAIVTFAVFAGFAFHAWQVDAAPGDVDATFVPTTPCRLVDTRPVPDRVGPSGALAADDTTTVVAHGINGECKIPTDAVGLSLNVTALGATSPTFVTVWPGGSRPLASSLNPAPGQPPTPNAVTTALSDSGNFNVYNLDGSLDLIIDVNGYYSNTSLQAVATLESRMPFAVNSTGGAVALLVGQYHTASSVVVQAPADGQVTVNWNSVFGHPGQAGDNLVCIVQRSTDPEPTSWRITDNPYMQWWSRGDLEFEGSLAGVRPFDVTTGSATTFELRCAGKGSDVGNVAIFHSNMTAIFTPAP